MAKRVTLYLGLAVLALSLAGCAGFTAVEQGAASAPLARVGAGATVGQTFVARQAGLDGLAVYLQPEVAGAGTLTLSLRAEALAGPEVAVARLPLSAVTAPGFYRLSFQPQADSRHRYYYARLALDGAGQVLVGRGPADAYVDGALYMDDEPTDTQMAFQLTYAAALGLSGLLEQAAGWLGGAVVVLLALVLPGWAVLGWLRPDGLAWPERLGLAAGLSAALYPVLLLWTYLVGLPLGAGYAWGPAGLALVWLAWRAARGWPGWGARLRAWRQAGHVWPDAALLAALALTVLVRCWVVRALEYPLWGDSLHHTEIVQLLLDHGGLFQSWAPYAELETFTYHFGFHSLAAVFAWLTGRPAAEAVLWTGQALNALAVVALVPLAARFTPNRWAAAGVVVAAGLLAPMPMHYVNWGRYTQLAGQVILPVVMYFVAAAVDAPPPGRRLLLGAGLTLAGLALTHYRLIFLAGVFLVAAVIGRRPSGPWRSRLGQLVGLGVFSGVLFLPWFVNTLAGQITRTFAAWLATPAAQTAAVVRDTNVVGDLRAYLPLYLWLAAGAVLVWMVWRRRVEAVTWLLWLGGALVITNPQRLGLPGEGLITNFVLLLFAYGPGAVLAGAGVGWLAEIGAQRAWSRWALAGALLGLGVWGATQRAAQLTPLQSQLVTRPDVRAAAWLRANTAPEARIGVSGFLAYGGTIAVGADGGWWLPLLARRAVTVPPITYTVERLATSDGAARVNALTGLVAERGWADPAVLAEAQAEGVRYIYFGQRQGRVNNPNPAADPAALLDRPEFQLVYRQDHVWIFAVVDGTSP